jgi:hypothetical protein
MHIQVTKAQANGLETLAQTLIDTKSGEVKANLSEVMTVTVKNCKFKKGVTSFTVQFGPDALKRKQQALGKSVASSKKKAEGKKVGGYVCVCE